MRRDQIENEVNLAVSCLKGKLFFQLGGHAADYQLLSVRCPISRTVRLVEAAIVRKRKLD
jgi:hypothetical protein